MIFKNIKKCRLCNSKNLIKILNLKDQPSSNALRSSLRIKEKIIPLSILFAKPVRLYNYHQQPIQNIYLIIMFGLLIRLNQLEIILKFFVTELYKSLKTIHLLLKLQVMMELF